MHLLMRMIARESLRGAVQSCSRDGMRARPRICVDIRHMLIWMDNKTHTPNVIEDIADDIFNIKLGSIRVFGRQVTFENLRKHG